MVIALVITTDGFPLAYEVIDGNTSDQSTLRGLLDKIENTYGTAKRLWVMDRGIPTEEILAEMRDPARQVSYLVGALQTQDQTIRTEVVRSAVGKNSRCVWFCPHPDARPRTARDPVIVSIPRR